MAPSTAEKTGMRFCDAFGNEELVSLLVGSISREFREGIGFRNKASPVPIEVGKKENTPFMYYIVDPHVFGKDHNISDEKKTLVSVKYKDFKQGTVWWSNDMPEYGVFIRRLHELPRKTKGAEHSVDPRMAYRLKGALYTLVHRQETDKEISKTKLSSNIVQGAARLLYYFGLSAPNAPRTTQTQPELLHVKLEQKVLPDTTGMETKDKTDPLSQHTSVKPIQSSPGENIKLEIKEPEIIQTGQPIQMEEFLFPPESLGMFTSENVVDNGLQPLPVGPGGQAETKEYHDDDFVATMLGMGAGQTDGAPRAPSDSDGSIAVDSNFYCIFNEEGGDEWSSNTGNGGQMFTESGSSYEITPYENGCSESAKRSRESSFSRESSLHPVDSSKKYGTVRGFRPVDSWLVEEARNKLHPHDFVQWSHDWQELLFKPRACSPVKLLIDPNDPRFQEWFIFPNSELDPQLPIGHVCFEINKSSTFGAATIVYADRVAKEIFQHDPTGAVGFFKNRMDSEIIYLYHVMKRLSRKRPDKGICYQSIYMSCTGKRMVLRVSLNFFNEGGGKPMMQIGFQDVSHHYQDVLALPALAF
mmetsp:Transcript_32295/g.51568  ORF Transcript_32295/g.51568 Transcript_32295/m.51568 type:complete len:585 (+) Transcript_32295:372-2126(+)